jgi:hypothetical protein
MTAKNSPMDPLEHQLREEALSAGPAFSEDLHRTTVSALRQVRLTHQVRQARESQPYPWYVWPSALAAAAALLVGLTLWHDQPIPQLPTIALLSPKPAEVDLPDANHIIRSGTEPLRQAMASLEPPRFGDLQQDARDLAHYFVRQLPLSVPCQPAEQDHKL